MAAYTAQDVKNLREATAAGMLDCKKALDEAEGDYNKAIDIIRVKGLKGVTKREGRLTSNGAVVAKVEGNLGVMLELNCETDFVAKGERFVALADELLAHLQNAQSDSLEAFLTTTMSNGKSVQATVDEANATLGEKIEVRRIAVLKDSPVGIYLHRTSPDLPPQVGVLVQLTKDAAEVGKDIAQHIAAFAPQFVNREDVPAELIENERRIAEETAREEGKPEASLIKIIEGRVTGFVKEVSLIEQSFAKDAKKTVKQILDEAGTAVKAFNRFRVGQ
ncbi:MAG: elongation factor Ts [Actinobacteria bacterium]|jgi:elongation factor Ts|nr:elongation factor Ts [Actinomycetota bacterium]NCW71826.1 elongation factor Ts [Actinomycetota bacterium]NCW91699.1 elongation factor Ts [Actinomycetota bacterium]NCX16134.1 elongation factor Ts [Actinomycetota bacterium]NCX37186.1 elongation factor Ts [Actinomycetota bacterium]